MDYNNKLNLESIDNIIEALIINIKLLLISLTQEQTKLFLSSFRLIQHKGAINTMTNLADQSFIYIITSTNLTAYHNNNLDPFTYVATS